MNYDQMCYCFDFNVASIIRDLRKHILMPEVSNGSSVIKENILLTDLADGTP